MKRDTYIHHMTGRIAGKVFKVRGQRCQCHDQTECHNGEGMRFDGVASKLTCFTVLNKSMF